MFYYFISMHLNAIVHDQNQIIYSAKKKFFCLSELPPTLPPMVILPRWPLNMMSVFFQRIRIDTLLDKKRLLRFVAKSNENCKQRILSQRVHQKEVKYNRESRMSKRKCLRERNPLELFRLSVEIMFSRDYSANIRSS